MSFVPSGGKLLVVRLDDVRQSAGPATVVAVVDSLDDYFRLVRDKDGARRPEFRLWIGEHEVGARVGLYAEEVVD